MHLLSHVEICMVRKPVRKYMYPHTLCPSILILPCSPSRVSADVERKQIDEGWGMDCFVVTIQRLDNFLMAAKHTYNLGKCLTLSEVMIQNQQPMSQAEKYWGFIFWKMENAFLPTCLLSLDFTLWNQLQIFHQSYWRFIYCFGVATCLPYWILCVLYTQGNFFFKGWHWGC